MFTFVTASHSVLFGNTADAGRVRLGGMAPALKTATVADAGRVRLGGMAPALKTGH